MCIYVVAIQRMLSLWISACKKRGWILWMRILVSLLSWISSSFRVTKWLLFEVKIWAATLHTNTRLYLFRSPRERKLNFSSLKYRCLQERARAVSLALCCTQRSTVRHVIAYFKACLYLCFFYWSCRHTRYPFCFHHNWILSSVIQGVTERCWVPHTSIRENAHINMCPDTFNLLAVAHVTPLVLTLVEDCSFRSPSFCLSPLRAKPVLQCYISVTRGTRCWPWPLSAPAWTGLCLPWWTSAFVVRTLSLSSISNLGLLRRCVHVLHVGVDTHSSMTAALC